MLIVFIFWLVRFIIGAEPMPLLQTTCENENQVFNSSEYGCYTCPNDFVAIESVCRPKNATLIVAYSNPIEYVPECDNNSIQFGLVCFPNNTFDDYKNNLKEAFQATYHDVIRNIKSDEYDRISTQINDEYIEQYAWAQLFHEVDPFNQTAVSLLGNACSVFSYDSNAYSCIKFNSNFTQGIGGKYGYLFWPSMGPFLTYGGSAPLKYISEEDYITKSYKLGDYLSFQLGRFSKYGEFRGFTPLTIDFQKCGESHDIANYWQRFGYNYYINCYIDMNELIMTDSTDFFDPFIEDGEYNGKVILRPIPVILKNYRGYQGDDVNRGKSDSNYRAVRRFFMNDNYTSNEIVQHIKSFGVTFTIKKNDKHSIYPPIFTIEYSQFRRDQLNGQDFIVEINEETISNPKYNFEVKYLREMNGFWQAIIIIFCLLVAVGLVYYFVQVVMFIRIYAVDGVRSSSVFGIIGNFFDLMGTIFFVVCFAFAFYIFVFFKFQHSTYICLPEESEFKPLIPILLVALLMKLIGIIFITVMKSSINVFIIDWEKPKEEDIPISGWRRIIVANEWNRILTVRHYNVAFTVLSMAFIIGGFKLEYLSTPIPSTELIDMDKKYYILRFAFTSFVWLLLILFQLLMTHFVIWPIFGNPFFNFIDLCSTSNISVLIRTCSFHGYYIHGRSPHFSSDEDMDELTANLKREKLDQVPKRGLINGSTEQVFETFLTDDCRHQLNDLYNSQLAQTGSPSVLNLKPHVAADIPHAAYETNQEVNEFLKQFFSNESDNKFVVQPKNCVQSFFNIAPTALEESVLTVIGDAAYRESMIAGIEWKLQLFYLLIFACIGIVVSSPCIPAIVVYIIDFIFVKIYNVMGRANLARKTLLDDRFFL